MGQSSTIEWPTQYGRLVTINSVTTSPPVSFPPQITIDASGGRLHVTLVPGTPPGTYEVEVRGTDSNGRAVVAHVQIVVTAVTIPISLSGRNPVVLLNGFQLLCLNSDSTVGASAGTFGELAMLLEDDDIPVAFFNNCSYGDVPIEQLANELGSFIANLRYNDGTPVTQQIDLVAHSMGGLIVRAYLAGLQPDGSFRPLPDPRVRKAVMIASPHFGSFEAPNIGTQTPEMVPGSSFLWKLATWNQDQDDLRGVDAIAIAGNAGNYYFGNNADDGVVSLTSASLNFARADQRTRVVPYCHVTPGLTTAFGTVGMICSGQQGIADIDSPSHLTAQIIQSFLADTLAWMSLGSPPSQNPVLSHYGGIYFAVENAAGSQYYNDLTQVAWGSIKLQNGGASDAVYYDEFIQGAGTFQFTSSSLGTVSCGSYTQLAGLYVVYRCKYGPIINSVTPRVPAITAVQVQSGSTITINGTGLGSQCSDCQVLAYPGNRSLSISAWTDPAITVFLPADLIGFVQLVVKASNGSDSIDIVVSSPPPATPVITSVVNAFSGAAAISPNSWITINGSNLASHQRTWQNSDFANNSMPAALDGVSVTLNGKHAYISYISATQLNILSPPDLDIGTVQVQVNNNGATSAPFNIQAQKYSLSFFTFDGSHVTATHADGTLLGPASLYPGRSSPAKPDEAIILYANGFGPSVTTIVSGSPTQSGSLPALPVITIGGNSATVQFAGLVSPGTYQFNVVVPAAAVPGDDNLAATYSGLTTQTGVVLAVGSSSSTNSQNFVVYGVDGGTGGSSTLYEIDPGSGGDASDSHNLISAD